MRELHEHGGPVIALNMVGSVTDAVDLVVTVTDYAVPAADEERS
ncbi:MAG: hypothetical protein M3153_00210 [Chloroflexota bacterium]|nr:hypothetical protein [Chloroflexota bacterium]